MLTLSSLYGYTAVNLDPDLSGHDFMDRLPFRMKQTRRFLFLASGIAFVGTQSISVGASPQPSQTASTLLQQQAILKQYCVSCHSPQVKSGGLVLAIQDLANPGAHAATYEKVVRKLRAGVMPPAGMPRPPKAAYD